MEKSGGLISGFGGAAILALFLSPAATTLPKSPSGATTIPASATQSKAPSVQNDSGPWSAICREYATATDDPKKHSEGPTGTSTHGTPAAAGDPTAVEYTTHTTTKHGVKVDLKYQVKAHTIGNIGDCLGRETNVQVLLATIPDPVASHFSLYFDRDIEALEAAAGNSGFAISQFWLPWEITEAPSAGATDLTRFAENKAKAQEPGVLVFHRGDGGRLFIFLVGETPTTGIDRVQFARALRYMKQVIEKTAPNQPPGSACDEASAIRIAGPHFSGSFLGMGEILSSPGIVSGKSCVDVVNPEGSSPELIQNFFDVMKTSKHLSGASDLSWSSPTTDRFPPCSGKENCLVSLKLQAPKLTKAALDYLSKMGYPNDHVAQLSEDESAFSVHDEITDPGLADSKSKTQSPPKVRQFTYPRDLSSLRNRSDSVSSGAEINGVKIPLLSIPVTFGETPHVVQDSPRAFATDQEASRIDHALGVIVERLRRSQTRALIIFASNSLDTMFLLKYFHQHLPNMRFVTLEADEFEIGRPQDVDLTGTLSISDLPLLRNAVQRKGYESRSVSFGSSDKEATYVAADLLIGNAPLSGVKQRPPNQCATESVVGRTGFVSLAPESNDMTFPCVDSKGQVAPYLIDTKDDLPNHDLFTVSHAWTGVLLLTFVITLIHLIYLWRSGAMKLGNTLCIRARSWSYPVDCVDHEAKRLGILTALNNQYLLINFAVLTTSYALGVLFRGHLLGQAASMLILVLSILCLGATSVLVLRIVESKRLHDAWLPLLLSFAYTAAAVVMWIRVLWFYPGYKPSNVPVNAFRISMISEGLSPLVPFLILTAAFIFYATVELYGIDWAARRGVCLPIDIKLYPNLKRFRACVDRLASSLQPCPSQIQPKFYFAIVGILLFGFSFHVWNSLMGFEGRFFRGWLFFCGFSLLLALVAFTVLRAWSLWTQLRDILSWLQDTKLGPAFAGLHDIDLPKLRIWDLGKREQDLTIHGRTVDSIGKLCGEEKAKAAHRALNAVRSARTNNRFHSAADAQCLFNELNAPMNDALAYLYREPTRYSRCGAESQRYLALRFVALIRFTLLNIRNLYTFVFYGFASLVVCVASYPFEGKAHLGSLLTAIFILLMFSVAAMMVQIQRNPILSLIENSTAGQVVYADLFKHLISVGGIPALLVLATEFPSLAQFLTSWIKPGVDLMK